MFCEGGVKPYYQDESVVLYHGDCLDILPLLPKVDFALTDPPYGMDFQSNMKREKFDKIANDGEMFVGWLPLLRAKTLACFTRWDLSAAWKAEIEKVHKVHGQIIWHKDKGGMGDLESSYALDYEAILYASEGGEWTVPGKRHGSIWRAMPDASTEYEHPTQKPVGIMQLCIERFGGDVILDPFAGSGTTLVAAKNLGKRAIGIELEEKYCEIAARRLSQGVLKLWGADSAA